MDIDKVFQGKDDALLIIRRNDLLEFANLYAERILIEKATPASQPEAEKPMTQPEAIQFLGKSRQTLIKWRRNGTIKGHSLGGRVYYLKSELLAAIKTQSE